MDIWEANKHATAFTPHPCSTVGPQKCMGDIECGYGENGERWMGLCDKDGCDLNTYRTSTAASMSILAQHGCVGSTTQVTLDIRHPTRDILRTDTATDHF